MHIQSVFTPVVVVGSKQILPGEFLNLLTLFAFDSYQAPQRVCVNADALLNMFAIVVTLPTFHSEMSPLNDDAPLNMEAMLFTLPTFHLEISLLNADA